jgi:LemA protein
MEIIIVLAAGILLYAIIIFNRLVRLRHQVLNAWSDIDVQLKRRHDLIPKLVDAVKQYADYEQATMTVVTELRTRSRATESIAEKGALEGQLGQQLQQLLVLAEAYPDLKANTSFLDLQQQLTDTENTLQYARRYYNGSVRDFNAQIESFPDLLIAGPMRFSGADYFEYVETV